MVLFDDPAVALPLVGVAAATAIAYLGSRVYARRRFYRDLPGPPHSMLWGHLKLIGDYTSRMPPGGFLQQALTQMKHDYGLPDVFYLDMWPILNGIICLTGADAVAYPTTANVWGQPDFLPSFYKDITGPTFIEINNGPFWKDLHQRMAPSLTPTAIKPYFPALVTAAVALRDDLARHSGPDAAAIRFQDAIGRFPFQILSQVTLGPDGLSEDLYQEAMRLVELHARAQVPGALILPWKRRGHKRELGACVGKIHAEALRQARARFEELQADKAAATSRFLDRMLLPRVQQGLPLDAALEEMCVANITGLIIAGYGTTTDTTTYIWLLLQAHPEILEKLRAEHDRVFGKDLDTTVAKLLKDPGLLNSLPYTTAVIQETLRLFPIAFSVRQAPPELKSITINNQEYPLLPDHIAGIISHAAHYNEEYFPEPARFLPDRFLDEEALARQPRHAYRPFERGPRACIGQALAMDEMKVQLLVLARSFDMELQRDETAFSRSTRGERGAGGGEGSKPEEESPAPAFAHAADLERMLGKHFFQVSAFTATPAGPVMMKIRPREKKE
ncbi:cytochrome P450 [Microdochium trichocladiopsis]|uniref:Cytochrome P450 n=1 Tax=Microdochium trichocladiopsis TaxID=1682393 RepID=A0A9P8XRL0_9PEZI|nr:cytochrome P450 [Microdochium trichocladiopsis]KAH7014195.1 cytochrome P450 [Microdochium trichocladiopsis]